MQPHTIWMNANDNVAIVANDGGLPMGADIEFADEVTLARALAGRSET